MTTLVYIAIVVGGFYLVRRIATFKGRLGAAMCVLVLLGLVIASQP